MKDETPQADAFGDDDQNGGRHKDRASYDACPHQTRSGHGGEGDRILIRVCHAKKAPRKEKSAGYDSQNEATDNPEELKQKFSAVQSLSFPEMEHVALT